MHNVYIIVNSKIGPIEKVSIFDALPHRIGLNRGF